MLQSDHHEVPLYRDRTWVPTYRAPVVGWLQDMVQQGMLSPMEAAAFVFLPSHHPHSPDWKVALLLLETERAPVQ